MDWLAPLFKLAHVALAMTFVAGLIGRWIVLGAAGRSTNMDRTTELLHTSGPFERMVIFSSAAILPAGLFTAWTQGYPWLGLTTGWMLASVVIFVAIGILVPTIFLPRGRSFADALAGAQQARQVTPALQAGFADPIVRAAHWAEVIGVAMIVVLMVLKPF